MAPVGTWERLEATGSSRVDSGRSLRVRGITSDDIPWAFGVAHVAGLDRFQCPTHYPSALETIQNNFPKIIFGQNDLPSPPPTPVPTVRDPLKATLGTVRRSSHAGAEVRGLANGLWSVCVAARHQTSCYYHKQRYTFIPSDGQARRNRPESKHGPQAPPRRHQEPCTDFPHKYRPYGTTKKK